MCLCSFHKWKIFLAHTSLTIKNQGKFLWRTNCRLSQKVVTNVLWEWLQVNEGRYVLRLLPLLLTWKRSWSHALVYQQTSFWALDPAKEVQHNNLIINFALCVRDFLTYLTPTTRRILHVYQKRLCLSYPILSQNVRLVKEQQLKFAY